MFSWPENTEPRSNCGRHCEEDSPDISEHCPCRFCHNAIHTAADSKRYVWFASRWAELISHKTIIPIAESDISRADDPDKIDESIETQPEPYLIEFNGSDEIPYSDN